MVESPIQRELVVYVVLLNWNGWRDTIECLESVLRLSYPHFRVVVCDNASTDGSRGKIEDWAVGLIDAASTSPNLSRLSLPPLQKPIAVTSIASPKSSRDDFPPGSQLVLIDTGANLGYAGGNNVGIRYALAHDDCAYVWVLNNDTVVEPDALSAMVKMVETHPGMGICGSLLRTYAPPHTIQTAGGRKYARWSGRSRPLTDIATPQLSNISGAPDYVEGASMLISRECLEQVGLLEEDYFLYSEEIDYVARARPAFLFGYTPQSVVYHKEGASIGSSIERGDRSTRSEFYLARNRLLFTTRYCPWFWPTILAMVGTSVLQRLLIGKPQNAIAIFRGAVASFSSKRSKGPAFD